MFNELDKVLSIVLAMIKPSEDDKIKLFKIYYYVRDLVEKCIENKIINKRITLSLQGSLAKDTFLKTQSDIDLFLLFDHEENVTVDWFKSILIPKLMSCFNNYQYTLNYASHPYITLHIDNVEVNIVPAFKVRSPDDIVSAVDRTPFHTEYIKTHLTETQKDEVRLLKQFLRSWKLYGAEIEVQGFSGYLTELLILAYDSFYNLLKNAVNWRAYRTCIDIEHHYKSIKDCLEKFKNNVLIVVDPVDARRNSAAAVSLKKFSLFKLLARLFMEKPSIQFFQEETIKDVDKNTEMAKISIDVRLRGYNSCIYIVLFDVIKQIPDVIWGQLNRLKSAIINSLTSYGVSKDLYSDIWVDDNLSKAVIAIEIIDCDKRYKLHIGPYAYDTNNAIKFFIKNKDSELGPWIGDDGRLYAIKKFDREIILRFIVSLISSMSLSGIRFVKAALVSNLTDLYSIDLANIDFLYWFKIFLERKPFKKISNLFNDVI